MQNLTVALYSTVFSFFKSLHGTQPGNLTVMINLKNPAATTPADVRPE